MRILVIGGMHGNEPLGIAIVKLFEKKPVKNVDVVLANTLAIKANCRFVETDLNRSFPGKSTSKKYELMRAAELLSLSKKYDLVLDFHNTYCPNNDCGFVGKYVDETVNTAATILGLKRIIVADYDCINKYASNCLSVEISLSSELNKPDVWYERIAHLSSRTALIECLDNLEKYRFVYRITQEDKERFGLHLKKLQAFQPIETQLAKRLRVPSPAYPIFIADKFTPYNYGGLLNKIDNSGNNTYSD
jgi:hypothetical protein